MRDKLKYFTVRSHMDHRSEIPLPPDPFKKQLDIVSSELRKTIRGNADIIKAASRFGVYPSTIYKLMDGRPLSLSVKKKICTRLVEPRVDDGPNQRLAVTLDRIMQVHRLYKEKSNLAAVGREVGVTRERVRQLMLQGSELGLFEYSTYKPPVIPKQKLLAEYQIHLSLQRVAELHETSADHIRRLFAAYGITQKQLHSLRVAALREGRKKRLIASYRRIRKELGYHPTATEMERRSRGWHRLYQKILRLWGSIHAFRSDLGIPPSTERLFAAWQQDPRFALLVAAERARRKERLLVWYHRVRKRLGHDPTTTQLQSGPESWRRLYNKIRYQWGSFGAFRKELGIPTSTKKSRSLRRRYQERGLDLERDAR